MAKLPASWLHVPFEAQDVAAKLEDMARCENIPKVSLFCTRKGFQEFAVMDCKRNILKAASMAEAVNEVMQQCEQ